MIGGLSLAAILLNWRFHRRSSQWHSAFASAAPKTDDKIDSQPPNVAQSHATE